MRSRITIIITGALTALALLAVTATAATNIHRANLNGTADFPAVNGDAKFGVDDGVRQLEAEIQDANSIVGQRVAFIVDGTRVAVRKVNALGDARIDVSGATVPAVDTGSVIRVRLIGDGFVATGRFN